MDKKTHWEEVYRTMAAEEVDWYQGHPAMSLSLIESTRVAKSGNLIDVGGGDSPLVDHLLQHGFEHLTVLDISSAALERAKARLGEREHRVTWIEGDVTDFRSSTTYDVWHDRALFHFLTEEEDRTRYLESMNRVIRPQGHVIIATFAYEAPATSSELPVVRYSPQFLGIAIGKNYEFVESVEQLHRTPGGHKQPFIYCRFRKRNV